MLLGEIIALTSLLAYYGAEAAFTLQDNFESLDEDFSDLSADLSTDKCSTINATYTSLSKLIALIFPIIQEQEGFKIPFGVNCSVYFNTEIREIYCSTQFDNVQSLSYEGEVGLPEVENQFISRDNILITNIVVGLVPKEHPHILYWMYPRTTATITESIKQSISISNDLTDSDIKSSTQTSNQTATSSKPVSHSDSVQATNSISKSIDATFSTSDEESLTQTSSQTVTNTASISDVNSQSSSISNMNSQTTTKSCSLISFVNVTKWSISSYMDATNQPERYIIDDCNHVVQDKLTGLIWEQNPSTTQTSWSLSGGTGSAQEYCQNLRKGGYNDWRLPAPLELQSLVDYTVNYNGPTINTTVFTGISTSYYYTSLPIAGSSTIPWYVSFGSVACKGGLIYTKSPGWVSCAPLDGYSWCVRGSNSAESIRYTDENGAILTGGSTQVKDQQTGLIWQRDQAPSTYSWSNAKSYCSSLTLGGQSWHLPTIKELATLVDYTIASPGPTINISAFPGTIVNTFLASSVVAGFSPSTWSINFADGRVRNDNNTAQVRCVRY